MVFDLNLIVIKLVQEEALVDWSIDAVFLVALVFYSRAYCDVSFLVNGVV